MKPMGSSRSEPQASSAPGRMGRLSRGPSTERLKALSVEEDDVWVQGVSFADW